MKKQSVMKGWDWILIGIILFTIIASSLLIYGTSQKQGSIVRVKLAGEIIGEYLLSEDQEIVIGSEQGTYNLLVIKNQTASITESDCENQLCVLQKAISQQGESIICLPHGLVVEIPSSKEIQSSETQLDSVSY